MQKYLWLFILFTLLQSCLSMQERYKSAVQTETKKRVSMEFVVKTDKKGNRQGTLTSSLLPSLRINGEVTTDASGDTLFLPNRIYFLTNESRSYTEGEWSCSGKLVWHTSAEGTYVRIIEPIEQIDILRGEMRINDTYYRKKEGLERIRNKLARINETIKFLKTQEGFPPFFTEEYGKNGFYLKTRQLLFPELYGFAALEKQGKLPKNFIVSGENSENTYVLSDDVAYNTKYTDAIFPEILKDVRNSGAMLRDFTETHELMAALYNFDYCVNTYVFSVEFVNKR